MSTNGVSPEWSGVFFEFDGTDKGMLMIHVADERSHRPPNGWTWTGFSVHDDGDTECHHYVRCPE